MRKLIVSLLMLLLIGSVGVMAFEERGSKFCEIRICNAETKIRTATRERADALREAERVALERHIREADQFGRRKYIPLNELPYTRTSVGDHIDFKSWSNKYRNLKSVEDWRTGKLVWKDSNRKTVGEIGE